MSSTVYKIFKQINNIPRPSHHEEKIADFLCSFAEKHGLEYERDSQNCVVIRKPASKACENAEPVVLLNHGDMVAVSDGKRPFNPLTDGISAYTKDGWMYADGTTLGADNGIGLSMALAVLADDTLQHGPLEVLTTSNEEDGMTGAAQLSPDFIRARKVINLDSEDYDTITVGAAGAYLQINTLNVRRLPSTEKLVFYRVTISGGHGGHSGVDINKGRCHANQTLCHVLRQTQAYQNGQLFLVEINGGEANASISGQCSVVVGVTRDSQQEFLRQIEEKAKALTQAYAQNDPLVKLQITEINNQKDPFENNLILDIVDQLPCGVIRMHDTLKDTVMTSNNIGMIKTLEEGNSQSCRITVSCHTRSFSDDEMVREAENITRVFNQYGSATEVLMNTPGWQENANSDFMSLVDNTFNDVLSFHPKKVAMHFVLEAGYYVQKFPGIEIACIGPRIIEPHSTKERVELATVDNIWKVLVELLKRLSDVDRSK